MNRKSKGASYVALLAFCLQDSPPYWYGISMIVSCFSSGTDSSVK